MGNKKLWFVDVENNWEVYLNGEKKCKHTARSTLSQSCGPQVIEDSDGTCVAALHDESEIFTDGDEYLEQLTGKAYRKFFLEWV